MSPKGWYAFQEESQLFKSPNANDFPVALSIYLMKSLPDIAGGE